MKPRLCRHCGQPAGAPIHTGGHPERCHEFEGADVTMLGLTIWQPWASLIAEGVKPVENRTWPTEDRVAQRARLIGQRIAIHAGKRFDHDAALHLSVRPAPVPRIVECSRKVESAIICTAVIDHFAARTTTDGLATGYAILSSPWFVGPVGWVLRDVRRFDPIVCRGAQGLWEVPRDVMARIPAEAR